jgi:hypothetical protein
MVKRFLTLFFVFLCSAAAVFAADEPAGIVLSTSGGVKVIRAGVQKDLAQQDAVFARDLITTALDGRAQILFADDSVISINEDSELDISLFNFDAESAPNFAAKMAKGAARFITGKIVERNPDGFSVGTPHSTIGIRGTTVFVEVEREKTFVSLELMTERDVVVRNAFTGEIAVLARVGSAMDILPSGNLEKAPSFSGSGGETVAVEGVAGGNSEVSQAPQPVTAYYGGTFNIGYEYQAAISFSLDLRTGEAKGGGAAILHNSGDHFSAALSGGRVNPNQSLNLHYGANPAISAAPGFALDGVTGIDISGKLNGDYSSAAIDSITAGRDGRADLNICANCDKNIPRLP